MAPPLRKASVSAGARPSLPQPSRAVPAMARRNGRSRVVSGRRHPWAPRATGVGEYRSGRRRVARRCAASRRLSSPSSSARRASSRYRCHAGGSGARPAGAARRSGHPKDHLHEVLAIEHAAHSDSAIKQRRVQGARDAPPARPRERRGASMPRRSPSSRAAAGSSAPSACCSRSDRHPAGGELLFTVIAARYERWRALVGKSFKMPKRGEPAEPGQALNDERRSIVRNFGQGFGSQTPSRAGVRGLAIKPASRAPPRCPPPL